MGASFIACMDAQPVLELAKHIFDAMSLTVKSAVVRDGHLAVGF